MKKITTIIIVSLLVGGLFVTVLGSEAVRGGDNTPPVITDGFYAFQNLDYSVQIEVNSVYDVESGIEHVKLYYKVPGSEFYASRIMTEAPNFGMTSATFQDFDDYIATIPSSEILQSGVLCYYVEARNGDGLIAKSSIQTLNVKHEYLAMPPERITTLPYVDEHFLYFGRIGTGIFKITLSGHPISSLENVYTFSLIIEGADDGLLDYMCGVDASQILVIFNQNEVEISNIKSQVDGGSPMWLEIAHAVYSIATLGVGSTLGEIATDIVKKLAIKVVKEAVTSALQFDVPPALSEVDNIGCMKIDFSTNSWWTSPATLNKYTLTFDAKFKNGKPSPLMFLPDMRGMTIPLPSVSPITTTLPALVEYRKEIIFTPSTPWFSIVAKSSDPLYALGSISETLITVENIGMVQGEFVLGVSFKHITDVDVNAFHATTITPSSWITLNPCESQTFMALRQIPTNARAGQYQIAVNCWWDPYNDAHLYPDDLIWRNVFIVGDPTLTIDSPTETSKANVGSYANPLPTFTALVSVNDLTTNDPILGLSNDNFKVYVGNKPATFTTTFQYDTDEYKFWIKPPSQSSGGEYDLKIDLMISGQIAKSTTNAKSVHYSSGEVSNVDVVLVIDRSGSMSGTKIEDAKTAAKQFVENMRINDSVGVVSFESAGWTTDDYYLTKIISNAVKIDAKNAIDTIYAGGSTAMGEGLRYGFNQLTTGLIQGTEVTYSLDSPHPYPNDYDNTWNISEAGAIKMRVHFTTIETESGCDYVYIYDSTDTLIASYDGTYSDLWTPWVSGDTIRIRLTSDYSYTYYGFSVDKYEYATASTQISANPQYIVLLSDGYHNDGEHPDNVIPEIQAAGIRVYTVGLGSDVDEVLMTDIASQTGGEYYYSPTSQELQDLYNKIAGVVTGQSTIISSSSAIDPDETQYLNAFVDSSIESVTFSTIVGGSELDLTLVDPNGSTIDETIASSDPDITFIATGTYKAYVVDDPTRGLWTIVVGGKDVFHDELYSVAVTADTNLTLSADTNKQRYSRYEPIQIMATVMNPNSVMTSIYAITSIIDPYSNTYDVMLFDDGAHNDGTANDGLFSNYFNENTISGSYTIKIKAVGVTPNGDTVSREMQKSIYVSGTTYTPPIITNQTSYSMTARQNGRANVTVEFQSTTEVTGVLSVTDLQGTNSTILASDISLSRKEIIMDSGDISTVDLSVRVPSDISTGRYDGYIILSSITNMRIPISLDVREFNIKLSIQDIDTNIAIGHSLDRTIYVNLIGHGGLEDIQVFPTGDIKDWVTCSINSTRADTSITIPEGGFARLDLNIEVPSNTTAGEYHGTLYMTSSDTTPLPIKVRILAVSYEFNISYSPSDCTLNPGQSTAFNLTLVNTGNIQNTIIFRVTGPEGWNTTLSNDMVILGVNDPNNITLAVIVPSDADAGDYNIIIDVMSEGDGSKTESITLTTTITAVEGLPFNLFYLILLLVVIGAVVGGAYMVKRRSKRRREKYREQPETSKELPQPEQYSQEQPIPTQPIHPQQYLCPTCGQALTYIQQHQRWYCFNCNRYV